MSSKTFEVNEANFQTEVLESQQPVLVDFWAEWCTPCKMIAPMVDEIATEYDGRLTVLPGSRARQTRHRPEGNACS